MARLPAPFDPASVPTNAGLAEALSAAGLRVFPCAPYDGYAAGKAAKAPLVLWRSSATAQRASVQRWWQQWPDAMPGIDLGASGFLVVDADGSAGIAAFEAICEPHGGVPECPMVDTPSGGRHYWFKLPKGLALGNGRGALPPKASCAIDIRGVGGFVIAPGALRDDGLYSIPDGDPLDVLHSPELPDFLRQVLTSTREEISPEPSSQNALAPIKAPKEITLPPVRIDMDNPRLRAWVESAFQQEIQALAQAGKGGRNEQLNRSAFAVYQLVAAGWIKDEHAHAALLDAAATCGLLKDDGRKQVLATLASGKRGGLAQPRQAPEEFASDDEDAALGAEIARRLVKSRDGTLHDADTGEVVEEPSPSVVADGWANFDPATIFSTPREVPQFPLSALGDGLAEWASAAARTVSAPVDYIATALLALAGGVLGNARWAEAPSGWTEPPILWTALVGDPSAGKSPAMSRATALADQIEAEMAKRHEEAVKDYVGKAVIAKLANEAWQAQVRAALKNTPGVPPAGMPPDAEEPQEPMRAQLIIGDATTEKVAYLAAGNPGGMLLTRDELAGWLAALGRYGGGDTDRTFFLEAYGGRSFTLNRVKLKEPLHIRHLTVGVLGSIQPDRLEPILDGVEDGFAARFLWCWPAPPETFRIVAERVSDALPRGVVNRLHGLPMGTAPDGRSEPVRVPLDATATRLLEAFGQRILERSRSVSGVFQGTLGKARGHALRLSCILEHLWWASQPGRHPAPAAISAKAMQCAVGLMEGYFLPMAERVFGDAVKPAAEKAEHRLAMHLKTERIDRFNARDLRHALGGSLRRAEEMDMACAELVEAGAIRAVGKTAPGRGRMPKNFEVNPRLLERRK
ncbi:DUF3987 domain-containing protein [Aquabacter sp. P-9]|uniref:DUF3987 domain-containing protein n=1 Tax=Aquabacter sediminis TaxID=3029197 RepID=UPI00237E7130|nr:DUF3987 domain-containing protein [Aquabacter sp. P-9]MDE1567104.1 DUF3987 domain-containing protein [Aquabacter sp. P-9]